MEKAPLKFSWAQLKDFVNNLRKDLSSLSAMIPSSIRFRDLNDCRTRIYFLSSPKSGWETTLLYVDVPTMGCNSSYKENSPMQWHFVLESNFPAISSIQYSREEQLLWERKRIATWGINSYELHEDSGKIIFPASSCLFQCTDSGNNTTAYFPTKLRMTAAGAKLNAQICPSNPDLVAYICQHDIWVTHTTSGCNVRLTHAHKGGRALAEDPLCAGVPSYVMQEEFSRYQGYWWQPMTTSSSNSVYRILYEEVDDNDVKIFCFPSSDSPDCLFSASSSVNIGLGFEEASHNHNVNDVDHGSPSVSKRGEVGVQNIGCANSKNLGYGEIEEFRFPRAGCANSKSYIKMIEFRVSDTMQIVHVVNLELQFNLHNLFPWMEYVVRAGWTPDGQYAWVQLLDRLQQRLELVLLPLSYFTEISQAAVDPQKPGQLCPLMQVLYSERSNIWVNVHDLLTFFPQSIWNQIRYIWASEESGFRHLYVITAELAYSSATMDSCANTDVENFISLQPRIVSKTALTNGNWEVLGGDIWVDYDQDLVYFMGTRDTVLEKHLYVVSLRQPGEIRLLTEKGFSCVAQFNASCTIALIVFSNTQNAPSCKIYRVVHHVTDYPSVNELELVLIGNLQQQVIATPSSFVHPDTSANFTPPLHYPLRSNTESASLNSFLCPELYCHKISAGVELHAMVFKAHGWQPGVKYPTVLNIYGGPEVQMVSNTYKGMRQLRLHMLAARGYCVIAIDSRGSQHRGIAFESYLRCRMGTVELNDQVEMLNWLADQLGYIDTNRIAIHGWSYGGYLSLMGLVQYPDLFKVAIAGAPVTNWALYDTGYTERYMDLPERNERGYAEGCVLNYIDKFPDSENRLLIIHGLIDENVHFYHTSQLINELIKLGKPYQLQIYPNERHSLRHLDASKHYETTLLAFLQNNL